MSVEWTVVTTSLESHAPIPIPPEQRLTLEAPGSAGGSERG